MQEVADQPTSANDLLGLNQLLARLGDTAEHVATALRREGFLGWRVSLRLSNPILRLVKARYPDAWDVDLDGDTLSLVVPECARQEITLPQAVKEFLGAFDQGNYLHLELDRD